MLRILLIGCFFLVVVPALAQTSFDAYVNEQVNAYLKVKQHVGLSVGIIQDDIMHTYHYGSVSKAYQLLPTDTSIYEIGSVTKTFTGLMLAHAVMENKISLQDNVSKYLDTPYRKWINNAAPVKIIHLANHTSGLPKNVPEFKTGLGPSGIIKQFNNFSKEQFLQQLDDIKINIVPGKSYSYSNADVQLLGVILEKIYGLSYAALLQKYITMPYNMHDTRLTISTNDIVRMVTGYDSGGKAMPNADMWKTIPEAGYIKSTTMDLLKYLQANMNTGNDTVMLTQHVSFKHTDEDGDDIGLYWFISKRPDGYTQISHAGGTFGCTSYCVMIPKLHIGIVCLANDAAPGTEKAIKQLAGNLINRLMIYKK